MRHSADCPHFYRITPKDTVVDIGCGSGNACVAAGKLGAEVIAIDIDPDLVPHLNERMRGVPARAFRAIASDCNPIPLPDGTASVVICTEVLEHVDDPSQFAAELYRIGRPGATYIVSVPDPSSESLMKVVAHPSYFEKPNHQRVFTHAAFDVLLNEAGFVGLERPEIPNNFYWAMWCLLRWSSSPGGNPAPHSLPPVIDQWNEVWDTLGSTPNGEAAIALLGRMIGRTQMVVARKPVMVPIATHGAAGWREFLRNGIVRLGRVDVSWSIRRSRASQRSGVATPAHQSPSKPGRPSGRRAGTDG